ncbi:hypothetical protein FA13DRAFT_1732664 [Coprinellus micaceus]|uniref:Uncharacterized protein n=1 Tax=Coprinellus micaceus TaxID=71717 RepID=A0A4Y7TB97_COPMI|nr:hypothetical protein FA13DRAFT_1732664 [Coprinellus micaceus]
MCGPTKISAHHKSFLDFLKDPRRSSHLGSIPQVAQEQFNQMIHLSSLTVDDLKKLVSGQAVEPHILHSLHQLCNTQTVVGSISPKAWMDILPSLSAWETLLLKQWAHVSLSYGPQIWDFEDSKTLQMMDKASKRSLPGLLFPGVKDEGPADPPPPILEVNVEFLVPKQDGQGSEISGHTFIPACRTRPLSPINIPFLPWFPAARALAQLWAPGCRLITNRVTRWQHPDSLGLHHLESSRIVFIIGSVGSGKRELLEQAYDLLPPDKKSGPLEGFLPPVDILIDTDGLSLRSQWTPGSFAEFYGAPVPCNNKDLTKRVDLGNMPPRLFQHWITCWNAKHVNTVHHPQFLLQGLHLLPPEHQAALLDEILSHAGQSDSTGRPPLFITVASLPTETLASRHCQLSRPGVYYVNLDGMKADVSLLERTLFQWVQYVRPPPPPPKIRKLARILAASPQPARHLKSLFKHWTDDRGEWQRRLDPVLAAPEAKAWRLIEVHFGDIPPDDEGGESGEEDWEGDGDESSSESGKEQCSDDGDAGEEVGTQVG